MPRDFTNKKFNKWWEYISRLWSFVSFQYEKQPIVFSYIEKYDVLRPSALC